MVLKAGIFLDVENLSRNGGWGMRYDVLRELVQAQGAIVVRANAYLAVDREREQEDDDARQRGEEYRNAIRRMGFHLIPKEVLRYRDSKGELVTKANADLDLAVEALLQADNLDYVLLGTGDGDFLRLVRALQGRGKRVDLLSFANTSRLLRQEVDYYFSGFLVPGLVADAANGDRKKRGVMYSVNEAKGYGFLSVRTGFGPTDFQSDIFLHIRDFTRNEETVDNAHFALLKTREAILEFEIEQQAGGKLKAINATEFQFARPG
jgi:uncharacterized LabA/DUF88 family protein/cold shock CspA family protein